MYHKVSCSESSQHRFHSNKILRGTLAALTLVTLTFIWSCKENPSGPEVYAGVSGTVYSRDGLRLDSARIYCMYVFNWPDAYLQNNHPSSIHDNPSIVRTANTGFGFDLAQNVPNPVSDSTFLRFSLPDPSTVRISITDPWNGHERYTYINHLLEGMYQLYLPDLVRSLNLRNGPYAYSMIAVSDSGSAYSASKELFVLSDHGNPNDVTGADGVYFFDYQSAFVGDSVIVNRNDFSTPYPVLLGRNVVLLVERRGYSAQPISVYLIPNVLVHADVVMGKEGQD